MEVVYIKMKEKELTKKEAEKLIKDKEYKGDISEIDLEKLTVENKK